jgi:hypothetical protein
MAGLRPPIAPEPSAVSLVMETTTSDAVSVPSLTGSTRHLVCNTGTVVLWARVAQTAAVGVALIPTPGAPSASFPILPGTSREFTLPPNTYIRTITP